jgi:glycosyltransferase involved in cell wall biosynthesis
MRTVLVCFEYPSLNGGENSFLAALPSLRAAGWMVRAAAPPGGPLAEALRQHGVSVTPLHLCDQAGRRLPQAECRRRLSRTITADPPAVVHANSLAMSRLVGPVARQLGIPSLGYLRDIVGLSRQAVTDLNDNSRLLAVSHATAEFHVRAGLNGAKTWVLYNGVDLDRFRARKPTGYLHRELQLPAASVLLGRIGQVGVRKGLDVVLQAFARLAETDADLHWLIVGERHSTKAEACAFEMNLRRQSESLGYRNRVHFVGRREDVARLLGELTLLVHAARQEPLGRVLLEAAASRIPVIATNAGGTAEIFPSGRAAAWLVAPDDPAALAAAIGTLRADHARRSAVASAGEQLVRCRFSATRCGQLLALHLESVCR